MITVSDAVLNSRRLQWLKIQQTNLELLDTKFGDQIKLKNNIKDLLKLMNK